MAFDPIELEDLDAAGDHDFVDAPDLDSLPEMEGLFLPDFWG